MQKTESFRNFLLKTIKTLVVLSTLYGMGWFVNVLPFAQSLPFLSAKLPIGVFLGAVLSLLMLVVLAAFGAEASPAVDGLLDFIPGAGKLFGNLVKIGAALFAYYSFQPAVFPFIPDFVWAYQSAFLGLILFFLARAGLLVYAASEDISRFLLGFLNPYGPAKEAGKEVKAEIKEVQPPN